LLQRPLLDHPAADPRTAATADCRSVGNEGLEGLAVLRGPDGLEGFEGLEGLDGLDQRDGDGPRPSRPHDDYRN
ncbi:hypothetical protein, partial [Cryobacterium sp. PH29-G1]|uniref:hypothetical protein n=1 Tax=Cryobacterium sp. PH29-G1 TaxID=3046211 RepID=UPI0024BAA316